MTDVPENLSQQEAVALLAERVAAVERAMTEAQAVANKYKLSFSFAPAYGMGGTYYGDENDRDEDSENGWYSSSMSC
jgi:hypothetical protein